MPRHDAEYVLPLRWQGEGTHEADVRELAAYLRSLSPLVDVTVVDGSPEAAFCSHQVAWGAVARHVRPQPWAGRNGKVAGVVTGVRLARHERVVIADDDVRHDARSLAELLRALDGDHDSGRAPDLVRPQNYFDPMPWHARWDTGRVLLNRALGHDHPGTFALRRSTFVHMGGYDGDALFENLELARTVRAAGGLERHRPDVHVRRLPPSTRQFWAQRPRQAYDDLAQPVRLAVELSLLPGGVLLAASGGPPAVLAALGLVVAVAEVGRRRAGGRQVFPASSTLWAVPWLIERACCVWLAVLLRALGGVPYRGRRVPRAATSLAELRRRARDRAAGTFGPDEWPDAGRGWPHERRHDLAG